VYITEKDAIITHSVLGRFVSFEGGDTSIGFEAQRDKPNGDVIHFQQPVERGNITCKRFYDPMVELPFEARHDKGDPIEGTIAVQYLDPDTGLVIPGRTKTFAACKVTKVTPPPKNANSYSPAETTYEFVWQKQA
jgi:hypothetical protein